MRLDKTQKSSRIFFYFLSFPLFIGAVRVFPFAIENAIEKIISSRIIASYLCIVERQESLRQEKLYLI